MVPFYQINCRMITGILLALLAWPQLGGHAADEDGGYVIYPGIPDSPGPVVFSHAIHGARGAGYACNRCHQDNTAAMNVLLNGISRKHVCDGCHDGQAKGPRRQITAVSIKDCKVCHMPNADIVITMNRMDPVPFSHLRHLAIDPAKKSNRRSGLSCGDCHPEPFSRATKSPIGMEVPHENGDGCARCHNGQKLKDGVPIAFSATTHCLSCHKS